MKNAINSISIRAKYSIEDNITNKLFSMGSTGKYLSKCSSANIGCPAVIFPTTGTSTNSFCV